jgi:hypothetical protein
MANYISYPFGDMASTALTATGAQAITISEAVTYLDGVTVEASGNRTLNLTISAEIKAGAMIYLASKTNGTETTIFGTGFTAPTITGEAGKTYTQAFYYNGTVFYPVGNFVKVD